MGIAPPSPHPPFPRELLSGTSYNGGIKHAVAVEADWLLTPPSDKVFGVMGRAHAWFRSDTSDVDVSVSYDSVW